MFILKAIYGKVWNRFSVFVCFLILSWLELAAGFGPMWPPHGLLWPGSWYPGQLLLVSYLSNPQPKTDYHQHFSTCRMKLVVTPDFMDLGPICTHNQSDLTHNWFNDLVFWLMLALREAVFHTVSTPQHSINSYWWNEGMSGWRRTSQLCQRCQFDLCSDSIH